MDEAGDPVPGLLLRTMVGTALFAIAVGLNDGLTLEAFVTLLIFAPWMLQKLSAFLQVIFDTLPTIGQ